MNDELFCLKYKVKPNKVLQTLQTNSANSEVIVLYIEVFCQAEPTNSPMP